MQGVPFAGQFRGPPKKYLFGFRGRMDERIDMVRSCTDGRYVYMRHFYPDRPYLKHVEYMFATATTRVWKEMFDAGTLNAAQAKFWQPKPVEELFDLEADPDEVNNLAAIPEHQQRVATMRKVLKDWMIQTGDLGLLTEAEMHRRAGDLSPREYVTTGKLDTARVAEIAFEAIDPAGKLGASELAELAKDKDSAVRFWAVRGLAIRSAGPVETALLEATNDESPSVAIAACDGLLKSENKSIRQQAIKRLLELANVEKVGHFAAIAAMNVLDMNAELDSETKAALKNLPRQVAKPPARIGKYVGKLIDHAVNQP